MVRRDTVPLHKNRQAKLVDVIHNFDNQHKRVTTHLGLGTGGRGSSICHLHSDWFFYDEGNLWLQIKQEDECRKDAENDACGACREAGRDKFKVKTEAGDGRLILISNTWTNHAAGGRKGEEQYFGLRDEVESYFALDVPGAPDDPRIKKGFDMIQAEGSDGLSLTTANNWLKEIAAESAIKAPLRARRLKKSLTKGTREEWLNDDIDEEDMKSVEEQIADHGTDDNGNQIPDITYHDLRACFCTQLMRNEVPPRKAIGKTGHSSPESLEPYVMFAADEIDAEEESEWF
jgi:hypothetical protein